MKSVSLLQSAARQAAEASARRRRAFQPGESLRRCLTESLCNQLFIADSQSHFIPLRCRWTALQNQTVSPPASELFHIVLNAGGWPNRAPASFPRPLSGRLLWAAGWKPRGPLHPHRPLRLLPFRPLPTSLRYQSFSRDQMRRILWRHRHHLQQRHRAPTRCPSSPKRRGGG